jgi:hypothetical protein
MADNMTIRVAAKDAKSREVLIDYNSIGVLERWSIGVLEYWSIGVLVLHGIKVNKLL